MNVRDPWRGRLPAVVVLTLILALSLSLRLADLDVYLTADESSWEARSMAFRQALRTGDYTQTYQSEHPGVITMWVGASAEVIAERVSGPSAVATTDAEVPTGVPALTVWARRIIALLTTLGIAGLYALLWRTLDRATALAAAALVALDPFFLAHSRVHHLDALLTTLVMLSAAALLAYRRTARPALLAVSGVLGGLAVVAKVPGVFLVPWAVTTLLWIAIAGRGAAGRGRWAARWASMTAIWVAAAALAIVVAWPAIWAAPRETFTQMLAGAAAEAGQPHASGAFFWHAIHSDPGAAYYPVVWAFRTTPWVVAGLAGLAFRRRRGGDGGALAALAALALIIGLGVTLSPKKFDRYILPACPLIDIIAAAGLVALWRRFVTPRLTSPAWRSGLGAVAILTLLGTQWAMIWPARPYYTSYYNPLVGGGGTAQEILQTGWGEGLEQAAAYLNAQSDAGDALIAAQWPNLIAPFARGEVARVNKLSPWEPDYVVLASSQVQRGIDAEAIEYYYVGEQPVYTAFSNGVPYAWVYINSHGRSDFDTLTTQIALHVLPPETAILLTTTPAFARQYQGPFTLIALHESTRADFLATVLSEQLGERRQVWLLDYPSTDAEMLAAVGELLQAYGTPSGNLSVGDIRATTYDLPSGAAALLGRPTLNTDYLVGGRLRLTGADLSGVDLAPGGTVRLRLFWRAEAPGERNWKVFVHAVGPDGTIYGQADAVPQGFERPTDTWPVGATIVDDYEFTIAEDAPTKDLELRIGMYDADTGERLEAVGARGDPQPDRSIMLVDPRGDAGR